MIEILLWIFGILFFGSILFRTLFKVDVTVGKMENYHEDIDPSDSDIDQLKKNQIAVNKSVVDIIEQINEQSEYIVKNANSHSNLIPLLEQLDTNIQKLNKRVKKIEDGIYTKNAS